MLARHLTLVLNDRCPLRCAHCSFGFSETYHGSPVHMTREQIEQTIASLLPSSYHMVVLAGGEPMLSLDLVAAGIEACRRVPVPSFIITAPFWAPTLDAANRFLDKIPSPTAVGLSFDRYHLEFLTTDHYKNAAIASSARGIDVSLNMTYASEADLRESIDQASSIRPHITGGMRGHRVLPKGNARALPDLMSGSVALNTVSDLDRMERSCTIGGVVVNHDMTTHMCCWSGDLVGSPLELQAKAPHSLREMEESATYRRMADRGLIDSLTEEAKREIVAKWAGQSFINECHLCLTMIEQGLFTKLLAGEPRRVFHLTPQDART